MRTAAAGRQAVLYSLTLGGSTVATAILYLTTARALAPGDFGQVASLLALATFVAALVDFGSNSAWVRAIPQQKLSDELVGSMMAGKVLAGFGAAVATAVGLMLTAGAVGVWTSVYCLVLVISQMSVVPLRADQMPARVLQATVVDRTTALSVLAFCHWAFGIDRATLPVALCCGGVAGSILAMTRSCRLRGLLVGVRRPRRPWVDSLFFGLSSLISSSQSLDQPITLLTIGSKSAGDLGAVARWTAPIVLVGTALSNAVGPIAAQAATVREACRRARSLAPLLGVGVATGIAMALLSPLLVPLLLGDAYAGAIPVFRLLAITAAVCVLSQPLMALLQYTGFDRAAFLVVASGAAIQFAALVPLLLAYGTAGAAVAALACQVWILVGLVTVLSLQARKRPIPVDAQEVL